VRSYLALAIAAVWAIAYVVSAASGDWAGFEATTPVMLIAVGYLFGTDIHRRSNGHKHP
jgi:hypothetical protein